MDNDQTKKQIDNSWAGNSNPPTPVNQASPPPTNIPVAPPSKKEELVDPFEAAKQKYSNFVKPTPVTPQPETPQNTPTPQIKLEPFKKPEPAPIPAQQPVTQQPITPKPEAKITVEENTRDIIPPATQQQPEQLKQTVPPTSQIQPEPKKATPFWKTILKTFGLFVGIAIFVFAFLNFPAYFDKAKYAVGGNSTSTQTTSSPTPTTSVAKSLLVSTGPEIFNEFAQIAMGSTVNNLPEVTPTPEPTPTATSSTTTPKTSTTSSTSSTLSNNMIYIAKIGKKAPVVWNSAPDEQTMLNNLHNGVVHYAGTALPGSGKGPIFISGHSSYYWWDSGKYKTVFATLDKLATGDEIKINYENTVYTYKVYDKQVVLPDQVDVLKPTNEPVLALMTCVPVGTNLKRLIVWARQE